MTIINLVILDVVHSMPEYQVLEQFNAGAIVHRRTTQASYHYTPGQDDVVPPKPRKIRSFEQQAISVLVGSGNDQTRIVGSIDAVFSCGDCHCDTDSDATFVGTHLVVLKVRRSSYLMMRGSNSLRNATNLVCAYLAMIQHGQGNGTR